MKENNPMRSIATAAATLILLTGGALQAAAQDTARKYPSFPGAVERAPDWLGKDVPFDIASFFAEIPPRQNAAPLYLDALFEFSADMTTCFAPGPERDARFAAARERSQRLKPFIEALMKDPASVDRAALQPALENYTAGFQKLDEAQRRPRCVFANGLGISSLLPHVQTSREVVWVASLRRLASQERGDLNAPIDDAARLLRFARDIQPRGVMITQLVYCAEIRALSRYLLLPVLSHPKLRGTQCNRLTKLLIEHESHALDGYSEGIKAEYLMVRSTLRDAAGRPGDRDRAAANKAREELLGLLRANPGMLGRAKPISVDLSKATPKEYADAVAECSTYHRNLLAAAKLPYTERMAKARGAANGTSARPSALLDLYHALRIQPEILIDPLARAEAELHGLETLGAVRRWEITHKALPRDLAAACREAGLKAVPIDPYSGQPMKFVILEGQPVVYSVGKDGKDDGGKVDSRNDTQPGDVIYRSRNDTQPGDVIYRLDRAG
jgi:hypothetical protein